MAEAPDGTVWMAGVEEMTSFLPASLLDDNQQSTIIPVPLEWWQRWWVWVIALTMLAFSIWRLARRYEIRRSQQAMRQLYREKRQKELQLNTIRLKAIPHFHSNVMAGIEYFMMNNSNEEATRYLKLYSDFTNQTLADLDRSSQTIEEELDYIKNYLELEQLRYGERLQYDIQVSDKVDRQAHLPTMLLHTYCQNAIKHGIRNNPGSEGTVKISTFLTKDYHVIEVQDDGVGFDTGGTKQEKKRRGIGVENVRARIEKQVKGTVDITSGKDGTVVTVRIPKVQGE
jgi:sensor histidine kinase YesM